MSRENIIRSCFRHCEYYPGGNDEISLTTIETTFAAYIAERERYELEPEIWIGCIYSYSKEISIKHNLTMSTHLLVRGRSDKSIHKCVVDGEFERLTLQEAKDVINDYKRKGYMIGSVYGRLSQRQAEIVNSI